MKSHASLTDRPLDGSLNRSQEVPRRSVSHSSRFVLMTRESNGDPQQHSGFDFVFLPISVLKLKPIQTSRPPPHFFPHTFIPPPAALLQLNAPVLAPTQAVAAPSSQPIPPLAPPSASRPPPLFFPSMYLPLKLPLLQRSRGFR